MKLKDLPPTGRLQFLRVTLSECVKAWLAHTGRSQTNVAARAKLPVPKLNAIVKGHNPNPRWETVERLAKGFGVPVHQFLAGPPTEWMAADTIVGAKKDTSYDLIGQTPGVDSPSNHESATHAHSRPSSPTIARVAEAIRTASTAIDLQLSYLRETVADIATASGLDDAGRDSSGPLEAPGTQTGARPVHRRKRAGSA